MYSAHDKQESPTSSGVMQPVSLNLLFFSTGARYSLTEENLE
jgi:hypothetical protein